MTVTCIRIENVLENDSALLYISFRIIRLRKPFIQFVFIFFFNCGYCLQFSLQSRTGFSAIGEVVNRFAIFFTVVLFYDYICCLMKIKEEHIKYYVVFLQKNPRHLAHNNLYLHQIHSLCCSIRAGV